MPASRRGILALVRLGKGRAGCNNFKEEHPVAALPSRKPGVPMSSVAVARVRYVLPVLLSLAAAPSANCQVASPPRPKAFDVRLRYQIFAGRNDRLAQFADLTRYLESVGFRKDPGPEAEAENPAETVMTGTVSAANARKLLGDTRVKSLLLLPAGYKPAEENDKPVKVQL